MLDNLPDAAKTGPVYQRIVQAASARSVAEHAEDLLSYGLFDWAVADTEVSEVFNSFVNRTPDQQEQFLADLDAKGKLGRLIANSTPGHHAAYIRPWLSTFDTKERRGNLSDRQMQILRTIVNEDIPIETMLLAAQVRFDVTLGPTTQRDKPPVAWTADGLRRTYLALELLPPAHVAHNAQLLRFGQFDKPPDASGVLVVGAYSPSQRELAINRQAEDIQPTALHETGHAVDAQLGWSAGDKPKDPKRGGWFQYRLNYGVCVTDMLADSAGGVTTQLDAAQQNDVKAAMSSAMANSNASGLEAAIKALPWFSGLAAPKRRAVLADRALAALPIGLGKPWFNATDGGEHLKDHVYQESYPQKWVRYEHAARARKLTDYQFRDPGEWFAEAYAFYYEPDPRGRGAKLNDKDSDTKAYFDASVHTLAPSR